MVSKNGIPSTPTTGQGKLQASSSIAINIAMANPSASWPSRFFQRTCPWERAPARVPYHCWYEVAPADLHSIFFYALEIDWLLVNLLLPGTREAQKRGDKGARSDRHCVRNIRFQENQAPAHRCTPKTAEHPARPASSTRTAHNLVSSLRPEPCGQERMHRACVGIAVCLRQTRAQPAHDNVRCSFVLFLPLVRTAQ